MIGRRSHDDAQAFLDACEGRTPRDRDIAELVRVAEDLCADAALIEPSPDFRQTVRSRLMAEAATVLVATPPAPRPAITAAKKQPARRRITTLTAAVVASVGAVGIVQSSASAVPGEILYLVKRSVESVELRLHQGDASRGSFQLARATERLAEARRLSADGRSTDLIADTLDDFSSAAADGSSRLFADYTANGQEKSVRQVNDFAATSSADLSKLSARLPAEAATSFAAAADAVTDLASKSSALCGACVPADVSAISGSAPTSGKPAATKPTKGASGIAPQPAAQPTTAPAPVGGSSTSPTKPSPTSAKPTVPVPTPATSKTPSLSDLTDPLLGGLLGDEQQPGLVPGLLGGLLGGPKP